METKRIVLTGSGGQGVITASIILAEAAAIHEDMNAVQTQAYGPEARGGATRADVVISHDPIRYPKVINPHLLVCLTQEAYNKYSEIIRPGGLLLTDTEFVTLERKIDAKQVELGMYRAVLDEIGKPIVFNICMLGALIGLSDVIKTKSVIAVLEGRIGPGFLEMNKKALQLGLRLAENQGK
jgi:2-oxoglutarate ferredoxin oxidoreductase subunit gamma